MNLKALWNRRTFLSSAGVFAGTLFNARKVFGFSRVAESRIAGIPEKLTGFGATGNVFEELGVTTVINAQGTMATLQDVQNLMRGHSARIAR